MCLWGVRAAGSPSLLLMLYHTCLSICPQSLPMTCTGCCPVTQINPPSFYVMKQISIFNPMVFAEIISKVETGFLWKSDPGPLPKPHHCAQRWWHSQPAATPTQAGRKISRDVPALLLNLSLGQLKIYIYFLTDNSTKCLSWSLLQLH